MPRRPGELQSSYLAWSEVAHSSLTPIAVPRHLRPHPASARNGIRALAAELLDKGCLSNNAHGLLSILLNASNNHLRTVQDHTVDDLAQKLKWGRSKTLVARYELLEIGFVVMHNRKGENANG